MGNLILLLCVSYLQKRGKKTEIRLNVLSQFFCIYRYIFTPLFFNSLQLSGSSQVVVEASLLEFAHWCT